MHFTQPLPPSYLIFSLKPCVYVWLRSVPSFPNNRCISANVAYTWNFSYTQYTLIPCRKNCASKISILLILIYIRFLAMYWNLFSLYGKGIDK